MKKTNHQNIPFKTKLLRDLSFIFVVLSLMLSSFFSFISIRSTIENEKKSSEIILERISTQIDTLYEQMDIAATSITKNPALKEVVLNFNIMDNTSSREYMQKLQQERTIQNILGNMMFSSIISNVMLYNSRRDYFYYTGLYLSDRSYIDQALEKNTAASLFPNGNTLYTSPAQSSWTPSEQMVISALKNFSDTATTKDTIVEIQVSSSLLDDLCTQDSFGTEKEILILDSQHHIVFPYSSEIKVLKPDKINHILKQIRTGTNKHFHFSYSFHSFYSQDTGFTILLLSNNQTLHNQMFSYICTTLGVLLLVLLTTLYIVFMVIGRVTNPLNQLISYVNTLSQQEDTNLLLPPDSLDEFEILRTSLDQMVSHLRASIQENYELQIRESSANLAALQAQIDPHFLYNALNSISAASEIYGSQVTTKMCQEFSSMMRYVTSRRQVVTLIDELSHTRNYLEFMKSSNDGNSDYTIEADPALYDLPIPKLSIQPFVENSFKHGFKSSMPPWIVHIRCECSFGHWKIEISDNGAGFTEEALLAITHAPVAFHTLEVHGLGLNNTFSRLSLHYGSGFSFTAENTLPGCRILLKGDFNYD